MPRSSEERAGTAFKNKLDQFAKRDLNSARLFLNRVISGREKDCVYDPKSGEVVSKPTAISVRVDACNALNKLVVSKSIPEKKDNASTPVKGATIDEAVQNVEKRKRLEADAKKAAMDKGKLARIVIGQE